MPKGELRTTIVPASVETPRNVEAAILPFQDGRLYLVYSAGERADHVDGGMPSGEIRLKGRWSYDEGDSWSEPFLVREMPGVPNVMEPSFLHLQDHRVLQVYMQRDTYVPNGNPVDTEKYEYKKNWLDSLIKKLKSISAKNPNIIIGGDFNIIPEANDVYNHKNFEDDALFRLEIRKKLRELINIGFNDAYRYFNATKEGYTFWDYMRGAWQKNNGMRIDHFLVSNSLIDQIKSININKDPRGREKPSDHTPIEIKLA